METNFIEDLNAGRDDWIIKVREVRLWNAFTMQDDKEPIFLEMILLDEKGTPLHAAVQKGMISRFSEMLQEGNIYAIKNIRISEANDTYKPVKGTIKGWFLQRTECDKINDQSLQIPRHYFEFTSYQDLLQRIGQKTLLIDIIGTLHGLGYEDDEVQVYGKPTKIRRLDLMLKGKEVVKVTLWRNIAMEFQQELQNHKEGTKTIAITSTIINTFRVSAQSTQLQVQGFTSTYRIQLLQTSKKEKHPKLKK